MGRVDLAAGGVPQVMGDEFQRQALGRRPEQGPARRRLRPGLEIGRVGSERPQGIFAHAFARQVFERCDVVVGKDLGEAVAPIHRQDGGKGVELQRPAGFGIGGREGRSVTDGASSKSSIRNWARRSRRSIGNLAARASCCRPGGVCGSAPDR